MRWYLLSVFTGIALSACGQVSELEAFVECTEKLESVLPAAKGLSDQNFSEDIGGIGETKTNGDFNFVVPATNGSVLWTCRGNLKSRRIDEVSFEGVVKKPSNAEYWSY